MIHFAIVAVLGTQKFVCSYVLGQTHWWRFFSKIPQKFRRPYCTYTNFFGLKRAIVEILDRSMHQNGITLVVNPMYTLIFCHFAEKKLPENCQLFLKFYIYWGGDN